MAVGKVWISEQVAAQFLRLRDKLDGHAPFLNVFTDELPKGSAALHQPTLYPELNVPAARDGDWGEVARGVAHLLSSLEGVPELRVAGTDVDAAIALDLNSELQNIAAAKEDLQPKPLWTAGAPAKLLAMVRNPDPETLDAARHFRFVQLHRLVLDEHPDAQAALEVARNEFPAETEAARATLDAILVEDLRTPAGKAIAAMKLLLALGFDPSKFYLQQTQYIPGIYGDRSLNYYPTLERHRIEFEGSRPSSGTWLRFELPFALPVLEGIYHTEGASTFIRHVRVLNVRAGWRATQGARIDSMMNPSGLYAHSVVELWLPGQLSLEPGAPPGDIQYKNIDRYPEALRAATLRLNGVIAALRSETGRSDIPEIIPSDLNGIEYKKVDADGSIAQQGKVNLESVRISTGAPSLNQEVILEARNLRQVSFGRELLESAKFYISAYNVRRAVLDFAGAFEAFVGEAITPRLGDVTRNTKDQFLRLYGPKLSDETRGEIEKLQLPREQDPFRMPSLRWQLKEYKRLGLRPALNQQHVSRVHKVMDKRNDAAHGRPVGPETLKNLVAGIEALELLIAGQGATSASD